MATKEWKTAAATGNFGTATNWVGDVAPAAGDDVVIDAGAVNIDAGLVTGLDLASLYIGPNYSGRVGNSTTAPLVFGCTSDVVVNGGALEHYLESSAAGIERIRIRKVGPSGTGRVYISGAQTYALVSIEQGTLSLHGTATITDLILKAGLDANGLQLAASYAKFIGVGGTVTNYRQGIGIGEVEDAGTTVLTTATVNSGTLTVHDGTLTTIIVFGGTVDLRTPNTVTTARVIGGLLDLSQSPITRTITNLYAHQGSTSNLDNGIGNIVVTNEFQLGGVVKKGS